MAKKTIAKYYSDLSGDEISVGTPTIKFGLEGASYEIDLTEAEQQAIRESLAPYIDAGRKATGARRSGTVTSGPSPKDVRTWAKDSGLDVPARGRIPATIIAAYQEAH